MRIVMTGGAENPSIVIMDRGALTTDVKQLPDRDNRFSYTDQDGLWFDPREPAFTVTTNGDEKPFFFAKGLGDGIGIARMGSGENGIEAVKEDVYAHYIGGKETGFARYSEDDKYAEPVFPLKRTIGGIQFEFSSDNSVI